MNELISQLDFTTENFSLLNYIVNIILATLLLYILSYVYEKQGYSMSNRKQLSRVLILVGVTTFIIISIVKSSLALSLGLVGALSIVRFRTAIKEPEELGFFFIAISIGLGMGANQLLPTIIGFIVVILIVKFLNKGGLDKGFTQNVLISLSPEEDNKDELVKSITDILTLNSQQLYLKRMSVTKDSLDINYLLKVASISDLQVITKNLVSFNKNIDLSFIDNEI